MNRHARIYSQIRARIRRILIGEILKRTPVRRHADIRQILSGLCKRSCLSIATWAYMSVRKCDPPVDKDVVQRALRATRTRVESEEWEEA